MHLFFSDDQNFVEKFSNYMDYAVGPSGFQGGTSNLFLNYNGWYHMVVV